jgi:hypothetical protein
MILKLLLPDESGRNHLHAWLASGVNDTGELKKKINIKLQFFSVFLFCLMLIVVSTVTPCLLGEDSKHGCQIFAGGK